jgi:hypothetical protein
MGYGDNADDDATPAPPAAAQPAQPAPAPAALPDERAQQATRRPSRMQSILQQHQKVPAQPGQDGLPPWEGDDRGN